MTIDASVYRTALDLSKPLPPRWSISQLQQPVPAAAAGLLALVTLGLGLARATGHGGSALAAAQWLDPLSERLQSAPLLRRLHHPGWSLAATAASFLFAYLRREAGPAEVVAYIAGVVVLAVPRGGRQRAPGAASAHRDNPRVVAACAGVRPGHRRDRAAVGTPSRRTGGRARTAPGCTWPRR